MSLEAVRTVLGWGAVLNLAIVGIWFFIFAFAHDRMLALHRRWFDIPRQAFDIIHYAGMAWYKVATWLLFVVPYCALRLLA